MVMQVGSPATICGPQQFEPPPAPQAEPSTGYAKFPENHVCIDGFSRTNILKGAEQH